jgi:hypothetical protein
MIGEKSLPHGRFEEIIMATVSSIPITVTDKATAWIAEQGMQHVFEQMLEHTKQTVPGLQSIKVILDEDPGCTIGPGIVIYSFRDNPCPGYDPVEDQWGDWKISTFPPEVCLNFVMMTIDEEGNHGR